MNKIDTMALIKQEDIKDMLHLTNELKAKLLNAKNAEEAAALLKADGQEITPEDAARLWEEISRMREKDGKELSLDELEAISGGEDRDWLVDGCAATVEADPGLCWTNDACILVEVYYYNKPYKKTCPFCNYGIATYAYSYRLVSRYFCVNCHLIFADD